MVWINFSHVQYSGNEKYFDTWKIFNIRLLFTFDVFLYIKNYWRKNIKSNGWKKHLETADKRIDHKNVI